MRVQEQTDGLKVDQRPAPWNESNNQARLLSMVRLIASVLVCQANSEPFGAFSPTRKGFEP